MLRVITQMVLGQKLAKKHPEQRASEDDRKDNRTAFDGTHGTLSLASVRGSEPIAGVGNMT